MYSLAQWGVYTQTPKAPLTPYTPVAIALSDARGCNTLQHTATHCNTLQHTATHCNTLQHTATHCNSLFDASGGMLDVHACMQGVGVRQSHVYSCVRSCIYVNALH